MADRDQLDRPAFYRIRARGRLAADWSDWFNGLALQAGQDEGGPVVTLSGYVQDQSALQGILNKLANLNLKLLGVELVDPADET
jgi:hypothetical protein